MNDWGYYLLLRQAAKTVFKQPNEQTLFIWYALLTSGYYAEAGYDAKKTYILISSIERLYNTLYLKKNNTELYVLNAGDKSNLNIKVHPQKYPDTKKIFSFRLNEFPLLKGNTLTRELDFNDKKIELKFDRSAMNFLNSFPLCELQTYFYTPISDYNLMALDKVLAPEFEGKSNKQIVNSLLGFIQNSIDYQTDQEQFGDERYLFAEESLFYPYADCEDRTVLLAQLVKKYTGLPAVALDFPEHVALAVNFKEKQTGSFINHEGEKYMICDPTYINSKIGMLVPDLRNKNAEIIAY